MSLHHRALLSLFVLAATVSSTPCVASAPSSDSERAQLKAAIADAERGQLDAGRAAALSGNPAYGWLEYATLRRTIETVGNDQAQAFLRRYDGQAVATAFRAVWLPAVARREDWPTLLANWVDTGNIGLRCAQLSARQATGKANAQWTSEAQALWRRSGKPLPDSCDAVFASLQARGGLTDALRWERIDAAADAQQPAVMRAAARGLPAADLALAGEYAAFVAAPGARALDWPRSERSRRIATDGLARLAKADPDAAEQQLPRYAQALGLSEAQQAQVRYQIALWTVASYLPESARRLQAVPDSAYDERLHEWRVREAMARGDWPATLAAIRRMGPAQRADSRWRYFEARMLEKTGQAAQARPLFAEAARSPTFHGFLAADRLQQPYLLCPWTPADSPAARAAVARHPAIVRAMELYRVDRAGWAIAEWNSALAGFDATQRRLAVEVAQDNGWFDRAVFSLDSTADEQRLYHLRFPLHHDDTIRREAARNAIDPAWVAAEIRAESIFSPSARSPANAMGLMQVLPATGAAVAKRIGLTSYGGATSLYDPETNIAIGTAYLRQLMNTYDGLPYVTIAAYNAGPTPTARWQAQRPGFDPDLWIETISYKETRDYVARVLAFSVIYDWRLSGDALPLSDRLMGRQVSARKSFACTAAAGGERAGAG